MAVEAIVAHLRFAHILPGHQLSEGMAFFTGFFGAVLISFLAILALHQFYTAIKPVHERRGH